MQGRLSPRTARLGGTHTYIEYTEEVNSKDPGAKTQGGESPEEPD